MIRNRLIAVSVVSAVVVLAACSRPAPERTDTVAPGSSALVMPLPLPGGSPVVARVQDVEITQDWLETIARGRRLDLSDPEQRGRALDELVEYVVLIDSVRHDVVEVVPELRMQIELNALAARANAVIANVTADPDEDELHAEYERQKEINGDHEYEIAHLLFDDQAVALEAALAVQGGQPFADVNEAFRERARQAVGLGWVKLGQLPPEFAESVRNLAEGDTVATPVQTSYGWHVIHLSSSRPFETPPYEQVREGIRRMLVSQQTRATIEALKAQARIELFEP